MRNTTSSTSYPVLVAMTLLFAAPLCCQTDNTVPSVIGEAAVAAVLNRTGLHVAASAVHLPTRLVSRSSAPELKIISVQALGKDQMLVGVRCQNAGDCLPFDATIDVPNSETISALTSSLARRVPSDSNTAAEQPTSSQGLHVRGMVEVKRGSEVTLIIRDGRRMEIRLAAIAMDSGTPGARVRVETVSPQKSFRAIVVDDATVLGGAE